MKKEHSTQLNCRTGFKCILYNNYGLVCPQPQLVHLDYLHSIYKVEKFLSKKPTYCVSKK